MTSPTEHRYPSGERAASGAPAVALAVQRAESSLLVPTPASASFGSFPSQGPAAFSRGGEG